MAINGPWYTSEDLINSIKRKISFPISQNTFSDNDFLDFANEEMMIAQVPNILKYHQEYFVANVNVPLIDNVSRYEIPNRAIGMKLRDMFWQDPQGNLFDMTRVEAEDAAFFQRNVGANTAIQKYYLEGNFVVLTPIVQASPQGSLYMTYFLRPNTLTTTDQAATVTNFLNNIVVDNTTLVSGNNITFSLTNNNSNFNNTFIQNMPLAPVAPVNTVLILTAGTDFAIGVSSIATASNLVTAINATGLYTATNDAGSSATVLLNYDTLQLTLGTNNVDAFFIQTDTQSVQFDSIPTTITNSSLVDFLQTQSGHRTKALDSFVPKTGISGNVITFDISEVPTDLIPGDYICPATLCIIPQIPTDLHSGLAERTAVRILAALGDMQGVQASQAKIDQISNAEDKLLDSRVEGSPRKILARHSLLRYGKAGPYRRI